eukprot:1523682-Rhodomonas_salina.2
MSPSLPFMWQAAGSDIRRRQDCQCVSDPPLHLILVVSCSSLSPVAVHSNYSILPAHLLPSVPTLASSFLTRHPAPCRRSTLLESSALHRHSFHLFLHANVCSSLTCHRPVQKPLLLRYKLQSTGQKQRSTTQDVGSEGGRVMNFSPRPTLSLSRNPSWTTCFQPH